MEAVLEVAGRFTVRAFGDVRARLMLAKNPAGWSEVLHYLAGIDTSVVIAVNARVADGKDPSWLWDVPYELLRGHPTAAAGERHLDVAGQRAAGKSAAWREIGLGTDPLLGFQPPLHFLRIGAHPFADRGDFIRENHRGR